MRTHACTRMGLLAIAVAVSGALHAQEATPTPPADPTGTPAAAAQPVPADGVSPGVPPGVDPNAPAPITVAPGVVPPQPGGITPGNMLSVPELDFARQEEELLREIRLTTLRVELRELQRKMVDDSAAPTTASMPSFPGGPEPPVIDAPPPEPMLLVGVWGPDSDLRADFFIKGYRYTARPGTTLPDGWVVERITRTGVEARQGRERRTFHFGGHSGGQAAR